MPGESFIDWLHIAEATGVLGDLGDATTAETARWLGLSELELIAYSLRTGHAVLAVGYPFSPRLLDRPASTEPWRLLAGEPLPDGAICVDVTVASDDERFGEALVERLRGAGLTAIHRRWWAPDWDRALCATRWFVPCLTERGSKPAARLGLQLGSKAGSMAGSEPWMMQRRRVLAMVAAWSRIRWASTAFSPVIPIGSGERGRSGDAGGLAADAALAGLPDLSADAVVALLGALHAGASYTLPESWASEHGTDRVEISGAGAFGRWRSIRASDGAWRVIPALPDGAPLFAPGESVVEAGFWPRSLHREGYPVRASAAGARVVLRNGADAAILHQLALAAFAAGRPVESHVLSREAISRMGNRFNADFRRTMHAQLDCTAGFARFADYLHAKDVVADLARGPFWSGVDASALDPAFAHRTAPLGTDRVAFERAGQQAWAVGDFGAAEQYQLAWACVAGTIRGQCLALQGAGLAAQVGGDINRARQHFVRALGLCPGDPDVTRLLTHLDTRRTLICLTALPTRSVLEARWKELTTRLSHHPLPPGVYSPVDHAQRLGEDDVIDAETVALVAGTWWRLLCARPPTLSLPAAASEAMNAAVVEALWLRDCNRHEEALAACSEAVAWTAIANAGPAVDRRIFEIHAGLLRRAGRLDEAYAFAARAVEIDAPPDIDRIDALCTLAVVEHDRGRIVEARRILSQAEALLSEGSDPEQARQVVDTIAFVERAMGLEPSTAGLSHPLAMFVDLLQTVIRRDDVYHPDVVAQLGAVMQDIEAEWLREPETPELAFLRIQGGAMLCHLAPNHPAAPSPATLRAWIDATQLSAEQAAQAQRLILLAEDPMRAPETNNRALWNRALAADARPADLDVALRVAPMLDPVPPTAAVIALAERLTHAHAELPPTLAAGLQAAQARRSMVEAVTLVPLMIALIHGEALTDTLAIGLVERLERLRPRLMRAMSSAAPAPEIWLQSVGEAITMWLKGNATREETCARLDRVDRDAWLAHDLPAPTPLASEAPDLDRVRRALGPGDEIAVFVLGHQLNDGIGVVIVLRHDDVTITPLFATGPLRSDLAAVGAALESGLWPREQLARLGAGLTATLRGDGILYVVPDGALYRCPFHALSAPDGLPIGAHRPVVLLPSLQTSTVPLASVGTRWVTLGGACFGPIQLRLESRGRFQSGDRVAPLSYWAAQLDALDTQSDTPLEPEPGQTPTLRELRGNEPRPLVFSRLESTRLAEKLTARGIPVYCRVGSAATIEALLATMADPEAPRVVHIACHGIGDADEPRLGGVILSNLDPAGAPVTGTLPFDRLRAIDWRGATLVLSACSTAVGRAVSFEGSIGLPWAALVAGAGAVLASLAPVDDRLAAHLIGLFTDALIDGASPEVALRRCWQAMVVDETSQVTLARFQLLRTFSTGELA